MQKVGDMRKLLREQLKADYNNSITELKKLSKAQLKELMPQDALSNAETSQQEEEQVEEKSKPKPKPKPKPKSKVVKSNNPISISAGGRLTFN